MTQMTPAQLRAAAESDLTELGEQRLSLLQQLEKVEKSLRPRVARAVEMEVPYRTIHTLTGVAPNTARAWAKQVEQAKEG